MFLMFGFTFTETNHEGGKAKWPHFRLHLFGAAPVRCKDHNLNNYAPPLSLPSALAPQQRM